MSRTVGSAEFACMSPEHRLDFVRMSPQTKRRAFRWDAREKRHAKWPACGQRHRDRLARQIREGRLKAENGVVVDKVKCILCGGVNCTGCEDARHADVS